MRNRNSLPVVLAVAFAVVAAGVGVFLALTSAGDGMRSRPVSKTETKENGGGFATPDVALDAMVNAIKADDVRAYHRCWTKNLQEKKDFEEMFLVYDKAVSPEAIEASWKSLFKQWREDLWAEGAYKRFPAEVEGVTASITCAHTLERYARYEYRKLDDGWYLMAHVVLNKKNVDAKYRWKEETKH